MLAPDQQRFIVALLLGIPLSLFFKKLHGAFFRKIYSLSVGLLLQYYVYGSDIYLYLLLNSFIYLLILIKGRKSGALVTWTSIIILSLYHIYRMWVEYGSWILDVSTVLMAAICRYSLFAYAYQDGHYLEPREESKENTKQRVLTPIQQSTALRALPSFFDFQCYCLFLPTAVIGTAIDYIDYQSFIKQQKEFPNVPLIPMFKKCVQDLMIGLVCGGFYIFGTIYFPLQTMKSEEFAMNAWYVFYYSFFCVTFLRCKYYFGWKLSQLAVHCSGISYQGKGQKDQFLRVQTCNPWKVQSTVHLKQKIENWNMSAQMWLKRCIFQRSAFKSKFLMQLETFMVSSFWHGFYGGYYFSFFLWFLQVYISGLVFKLSKTPSVEKMYKKTGFIGKVVLWVVSNWLFTHNGLYFQILSASHSVEILKCIWVVPPILMFLVLAYLSQPRKTKKKQL